MASEKTGRAAHGGPNFWRVTAWSLALVLLLLPLGAMQLTTEVHWTASDFVFASMMIGGVGGAFELAVRRSRVPAYRLGIAALLATLFAIVWINAAVGIIGSEDNPWNALYAIIVAVAGIGAIAARFRAAGMARAMAAAAIVQLAVGVVAVVLGRTEPPGALGEIVLNGGLASGFAVAGWLFHRADRGGRRPGSGQTVHPAETF